jgi:hypothetical protein
MEDTQEAPTPTIKLVPGKLADGKLGVTLILDPAATVGYGGGDPIPGVVLSPQRARLLAYALLHQAESVELGLVSSAQC